EVSTGAQQDLKQATDLVSKMVSEWGMSDRLGATSFPRSDDQPVPGYGQSSHFSEQTAEVMDAEIRRILEEIDAYATRLLRDSKEHLDALAKRVLEDETLSSKEIEGVLKNAAA